MKRFIRVIRRYVGLLIAAGAALGVMSCSGPVRSQARDYCAILPDSIGLYAGNPVTQMGYQIGTVNKMTPSASSVRVDFSVDNNRALPGDVKAIIRSTSILADRALELAGNYESGPKLEPDQCIPLDRAVTPKSLSQVIGSANEFVNGINPQNSENIGDTLKLLDEAIQDNGVGVNQILTVTSRLVDSPDQPVSNLQSIVVNMASLTETMVDLRDPMKQILNDAAASTHFLPPALTGGSWVVGRPTRDLIQLVADLETHAGDETQLTLDAVSDVVRINSPHAHGWVSALGGILKPLPWWINGAANHVNNRGFSLSYRPPLYRIRTPNGAVICNVMNFSNPGSCANVAGQPYFVDINLLQYVFTEASR